MRRSVAMAGCGAALLVTLAACGGGSSDSSGSESASSSPSMPTSSSAGPEPSGEPLKIGLINQENETIAFPEGSAAAKAVIAYLNAEQGGIDGRPAELVLCTTGDSAESAVACANQFANDPSVPLVIVNTYNSAAVNKILVGKKALFTFNNDIPDMTTPDLYTLDPGILVPASVSAQILADQGVKTASIMYTDDPTVTAAIVPLVDAALTAAGIEVKQQVPVKSGGDYSAAVAAADPTGVDGVMMLLVDNSQCGPVGEALTDFGSTAKIVSADVCSAPTTVETGAVDGWRFPVTNTGSIDPAQPGPGTEELRRILTTYSEGEPNFATLAGFTAAHVMAAVDLYTQVGADNVTTESLNELLAAGWQAQPLSYAPVSCPGQDPFIGACATSQFVAEAVDGKLILVSETPITVDLAPYAELLG